MCITEIEQHIQSERFNQPFILVTHLLNSQKMIVDVLVYAVVNATP